MAPLDTYRVIIYLQKGRGNRHPKTNYFDWDPAAAALADVFPTLAAVAVSYRCFWMVDIILAFCCSEAARSSRRSSARRRTSGSSPGEATATESRRARRLSSSTGLRGSACSLRKYCQDTSESHYHILVPPQSVHVNDILRGHSPGQRAPVRSCPSSA